MTAAWKKLRFILSVRSDFQIIDNLLIAVHAFANLVSIGSGHIDTAIWLHYMDANKTAGEEARRQLHKNATCNLKEVLAAAPHKTPTVRPPTPYHENYSS